MKNTTDSQSIQKIVLFMVLLNAFTTPLMLSATNVALPQIADDLSLNAVMLGWVPMAFLMASAMFVLIFGRIADIIGRKRIFLIGTICVIVTSLFAAYAWSGITLVLARFLQGVSAAMLYATQVAIVSSVFPPKQRGRAIGMTVSSIYLGLTCGPLIGGYLIDMFGWRSSFVFYIPLALVVLYFGLFKVHDDWSAEEKTSFDIMGAVIYALSIVLLCVGASRLPDISGVICLGIGIIGVWCFVMHARKVDAPVFDVSLFFKNRVFTLSCLSSFIIYTSIYANIVLISLYLQYLKDLPATTTGIILMVQPLTMALFSPAIGHLSDRIEPKIIASLGMAITAIGLYMLSTLSIHSTLTLLIVALFITGLGVSLFSSPNANAIMSAVDKKQYGSATGSLATMRILGQMMSMVLVTLVFAVIIGQVQIEPSNFSNLQQAISISFVIAAAICVPGILFSLVRGRMHQTTS